jgi:uncharacterized membrane protein YdjX (TVP38/TMEM64 family)
MGLGRSRALSWIRLFGGWVRAHPWKLVFILLAAVAAGYAAHGVGQRWSREEMIAFGRGVPAWVFVASFFVLPLLGIPISLFLLLAGVRFGFGWGLALTVVGMYFHTLAAYRITHGLFRERVKRWFARRDRHIPSIKVKHRGWLTALFAAVHGPPYFVKLYMLSLTDIPLRIHLRYGTPTYILFAIPPLAFGNAIADMGIAWLLVILLLAGATMVAGHWIKRTFTDERNTRKPGLNTEGAAGEDQDNSRI